MQKPAKPQARRYAVRRASFSRKFTARHARARTSNESVIALAHDARNVVAALELCCDLLAEPGVLAKENQHFATELQAVASASSALVEQLAALRVVGVRGWASTRICSTSKPRPRSGHIDDLAGGDIDQQQVRSVAHPLGAGRRRQQGCARRPREYRRSRLQLPSAPDTVGKAFAGRAAFLAHTRKVRPDTRSDNDTACACRGKGAPDEVAKKRGQSLKPIGAFHSRRHTRP